MTAPQSAAAEARSEFVAGTQACRVSVLAPHNDLGLDPALRQALAARMCRLIGMAAMAQDYQQGLTDSALLAIAAGAPADTPRHAAILRQVDLVTLTPKAATAADLAALEQAGLSVPQIVALSELIAFVNFETRVRHGLALLEAAE